MIAIQDVWKAKKRIASLVGRTPLLHCPALSDRMGGNIHLKLESMHEIGAFKIRGAANKILSLSENEQKRGVTTYSTGNHGLAVAYVARQIGIEAVICVSRRVPKAKADAIRKFGGKLEIYGDSQDEAGRRCLELRKQHGMTIIEPFDDPEIIAGQGTIGLELLEDQPSIDAAVVPLSGGGLISGIALSLKANRPDMKVIGVSMQHSPVMFESQKAGRPIEMQESDTLADSLLGGIGLENRHTFDMVKKYVDETILVDETMIADGMTFMMEEHRLVTEGAAAVGVGALLHNILPVSGHNTAIIISGKNIDLTAFYNVVNASKS
ncbi:MAG TPA: hydroxyectoine utilization dehydratase EutB [Bacillales bacterium]|nr:hydroxyectoine utilization dehydratase EutB [Bacillales bacterium]